MDKHNSFVHSMDFSVDLSIFNQYVGHSSSSSQTQARESMYLLSVPEGCPLEYVDVQSWVASARVVAEALGRDRFAHRRPLSLWLTHSCR